MKQPQPSSPVAVVGAGSIGVAFALVFARANVPVRIWDPAASRRSAVLPELEARLGDLASYDLLAEAAGTILERVTVCDELVTAVAGAQYVQECAPERVELKQELFAELDRLAPPQAVLASSSSFLLASSFAADLPGRGRCLVAHPGNPPYLIPVIELVPAPFTEGVATQRAEALLALVGLSPVHVRREVEGFIFNRLQGALLREAYCLVRDGVASVKDVDRVVRDGLGRRWAHIGPFETADLNTRGGIAAHAERMGPSYARMGAERGQDDAWTPDLVAQVERERRAILPAEEWEARVAWRDRQLMAALKARQGA
ncbi:3-hydroxyacyl-CoA dehydrogenase [Muricoccus aerilatus]|uniref:3-hydroxyacyl-CoA dehydrogenase n=1 Tax=Muricoccus aerilatus TaxID=452982 RepID=UPI0005C1A3A8|nr:3-hydroxyacyl-CoA dehydrogenase [Roseomonas aerilata]